MLTDYEPTTFYREETLPSITALNVYHLYEVCAALRNVLGTAYAGTQNPEPKTRKLDMRFTQSLPPLSHMHETKEPPTPIVCAHGAEWFFLSPRGLR